MKIQHKTLYQIISENMLTNFKAYPDWMKWTLKHVFGVPLDVPDPLANDSGSTSFSEDFAKLQQNKDKLMQKSEQERFNVLSNIYKGNNMSITEKVLADWNITNEEYKKKALKTQALIISKSEPKITFQPDKEDKMYSMGNQTVFTKKDDMLGKTFEDIKKQLTNLNTMTTNTISILNEHTKIFADMLNIDKQQLGILTSLVPIPEKNEKQFPNMSDIRDPAYDYRSKVYDRLRGGV
jgi:hypothetical protein